MKLVNYLDDTITSIVEISQALRHYMVCRYHGAMLPEPPTYDYLVNRLRNCRALKPSIDLRHQDKLVSETKFSLRDILSTMQQ